VKKSKVIFKIFKLNFNVKNQKYKK